MPVTKTEATETNSWLRDGFPASLSYTTRWEVRLEDYKTSEPADAIMVMQLLVLSHASPQKNASSLAKFYDQTMKSANENVETQIKEAMVNCMVRGIPLNPYIELLREIQDPHATKPSYESALRHKNISQMIRLAVFRHPDLDLTLSQRITMGGQMAKRTVEYIDFDDEKRLEEVLSTRKAIASLLNLRKEAEFPSPMRKIEPAEIEKAFLDSVGQSSKASVKERERRVELHHLPNPTTKRNLSQNNSIFTPLRNPPPIPLLPRIRTIGYPGQVPHLPFASIPPQPRPPPQTQRTQAAVSSRHSNQQLGRLVHRLAVLSVEESEIDQEHNSSDDASDSDGDLLGPAMKRLEKMIETEEMRVRLRRQLRDRQVQ